ncbi:penicillin acylase family protein [Alteromonas gracilis]
MAPVPEAPAPDRDRFRDWPRPARWVVYGLVALLVLLVVVAGAGRWVLQRPVEQVAGRLTLEGLTERVDVRRDDHGVVHVYADSPGDLFYAQGYTAAQDRFWQMDLRRHVTAGRLSELFGERTLRTDQFTRTMGWHRVAERELRLLDPDTRSALESYADGVNAWLEGRARSEMSFEHFVLGRTASYRPGPWSAVDSLAWLKAMAWDLGGNYADEIDRARLSVDRDPVQINELYPPYPYEDHPTIVPSSPLARPAPAWSRPATSPRSAPEELPGDDPADLLPALLGVGDGIGSNSWVVSGELTTTGAPMLANDPHLGVDQPGTFTQIGLHCRSVSPSCPYDVSGFAFAGFPGVTIGRNQDIAWGLTNFRADTMDLVLEKVTGKTYLRGGEQVELEERDERIRVQGGDTRLITVRSTVHGPLLSDVSPELSSVGANAPVGPDAPERGNGYAVALEWTALTPGRTADAVIRLNRARDWEEFRTAVSLLEAPAQSLVYADAAGNIGYTATGRIPLRRANRTGDYPAEGWDLSQDWSGRFIAPQDLPSSFNPPSGRIVAANNPVAGPGYSSRLEDRADYGYRAARITALLDRNVRAGVKLRVADMERIQNDTVNPMGPILTPYLLDVLMPSAYDAAGQQLLAEWDHTQPADSAAAAYFNVVWAELLEITFQDQLRQSLWPDGGSRWMRVVTLLLEDADNPWWDDVTTEDVVEDRDAILGRAMAQARDEMVRRQARDPEQWQWGHLHRLPLESRIFGDTALGWLFGRSTPGVPGGGGAVNATAYDPRRGFAVTNAPVMRMVVDLGDLDRSRWISLAGQSGHPASSTYDDQRDLWLRGESLPWRASRQAVDEEATDLLRLDPPR